MLKFIGSGSAFNTKLGNNSAYYIKGDRMLLIDCGSNIFQKIKESNILEGVNHIHAVVTHCHADHVGSLADLILYTYYSHGEFAKKKVTVYSPVSTYVDGILSYNGCEEGVHHSELLVDSDGSIYITDMDILCTFFETEHVGEIHSYGVELDIAGDKILYTSDTNSLDKNIVKRVNDKDYYSYVFIDTCKADYEGNVHLSLRKLTGLIKEDARDRVYCMHLDENFSREEAEELGFNVVLNNAKR